MARVYLNESQVEYLRFLGCAVEVTEYYMEDSKPRLWRCHMSDAQYTALDAYIRQKNQNFAGMPIEEYLQRLFGDPKNESTVEQLRLF